MTLFPFASNLSSYRYLTHILVQATQDEKASMEAELKHLKEKQQEIIKAKCVEVFEQTFVRYLRTGVLNSCSRFRAEWEMAFHPPEDRVVVDPDVYNLMNNVEVGNYDQSHYIEKEGMCINYVLEDEEDDFIEEEPKDVALQVETNKDLSCSSNAPATS